jgi:hypothetical protein
MTPTLAGRIQTRLFLLATVGLGWTILIAWLLPRGGATVDRVYAATFFALIMVGLFGLAWEMLYHAIQQYRWEKDWPTLLALLVGIPESIPVLIVVDAAFSPPPFTFFFHFITTWTLVWLTAIGPMRVFLIRWRYRGGRIL